MIDAFDDGYGFWIKFDNECDLRIWNDYRIEGGPLIGTAVTDVADVEQSMMISFSNGSSVMIDLSDNGCKGPEAFYASRTPHHCR
ncbi:hypothetical protein [Sphingomonas sp.]|uniref:hypothetical protein n=1 Tax=Sphingomonas sp. TaxID=28214 RepID=UPI002E2ED7C8|nr:hypothetical protein [Sphingomonas sp.]HEX4694905.1 hypothetical protein [Sphingomonas sp.]